MIELINAERRTGCDICVRVPHRRLRSHRRSAAGDRAPGVLPEVWWDTEKPTFEWAESIFQ